MKVSLEELEYAAETDAVGTLRMLGVIRTVMAVLQDMREKRCELGGQVVPGIELESHCDDRVRELDRSDMSSCP